jgi:hypothetical protein
MEAAGKQVNRETRETRETTTRVKERRNEGFDGGWRIGQ